ncbi:alpha/beta hydrolase [Dactylosporangium sp. CA-092794]|uniref:alpha/beta hydrolase n=1 Tax=Dactylosporangium sp. CA-092794 TaxID=3239929 RepID=UPI003D8E0A02
MFQGLVPQISPVAGVYPGVPPDNAIAAAYAVSCGDARWPHDVSTYARNVAADRKAYPLSAGAEANIWPCAFWPSAPAEPAVKITGGGPRNILLLQNERDPNTPIEGARDMRKALANRSVMVTITAGGHGVYFNGIPAAQRPATPSSPPAPSQTTTPPARAFLI